MRKLIFFPLNVLVLFSLVVAACGPVSTEAPQPTQPPATQPPQPTAQPQPTSPPAPTAAPEKVQIRWFVGLGTGGNPEQIDAQKKVVEQFNATHDNIELVIEIVQNDVAYDTLKTQIASGNPPDIVGPVGVRGANGFSGAWLDLTPLIEKTGYDMSQFDEGAVKFWNIAGEGQVGIPFAVFPSFIFYNRDLFDEAGLPYPPHKFGEKYDGKEWNIETLTELAMKLTVDKNGNDATSPDFDPENIVQFGYHTQWTDPRGEATLFGAGSVYDNGKAVIPDHWRAAWKWYYDGIWNKHFIPSDAYTGSDLLAAGNPFSSGNLAMAHVHLWYTCCLGDVKNWDIAVVPSYQGKYTAKLHADTFRILKSTRHPDEAFEVLTYLMGEAAPQLLQVYGGMPARKSEQEAFFKALDARYPQGVDWQVAIDSLSYPDNPSHEADMPNFLIANDRIGAFQTLYRSTPGLDLDAEIDKLQKDLQRMFDSAK
ncbi:MAG: extracellular solute-binding protein [Anaerolineales bacterium]|nr:extracellular solute-binding protein [Anaerolineales bacterium]